jgi:hypothetical protein
MVEHPGLRAALEQAIDGKGAFRRFKDVLMSYATERERWFAFRSERLRVFMEAWLAAHAIVPIRRPEWKAEASAAPAETPSTKRARSADTLRRQLRDLSELLGARDLDKVLVFAEFIKARRDARTPSRTEASSGLGHPAPEPPVSELHPDEDAPSSEPRKVTLIGR